MRRSASIVVVLLLALVQTLGASAAYGARCGLAVEACAKRPCCKTSDTTQLRAVMPCCRPGSLSQAPTSGVATRDEQQAVALLSTPIATSVVLALSSAPRTGACDLARPPRIPLFLRNRSLLL